MADDRPLGPDAVVAAVLDAAATLFAERGPSAVSLRDVAAAANVNLGLIHRYIGSKDDLLAATLARRAWTAEEFGTDPGAVAATLLLTSDVEVRRFFRLLLQAHLDGYDVWRLRPAMPVLTSVARTARERLPDVDADVRTALVASMIFGWHAVGQTYLNALGRKDLSDEDLAALVRPVVDAMYGAAPVS